MSAQVFLRHPEKKDLKEFILIRNASRRGLPEHRDESLAEINADIFNPDYDPKGCWVAFSGGKAVGYAVGLIESGRLKTGRKEARIDFEVLPVDRGRGIEEEFVRRVLGYAKRSGMDCVLTRCEEQDGWRKKLLMDSGFEDVHHWYRMVREGICGPRSCRLPAEFKLKSEMLNRIPDETIMKTLSVSNSAFSEMFDFYPWTFEDFIRFRDSTIDIERAAWVEKDCEMVGFCLSEESVAYNREHNSKMGYIVSLGVLKRYRGLGIGSALLADGIEWVLGKGMDRIFLAVDAENPSALRLYTSFGFSILRDGTYFRATL